MFRLLCCTMFTNHNMECVLTLEGAIYIMVTGSTQAEKGPCRSMSSFSHSIYSTGLFIIAVLQQQRHWGVNKDMKSTQQETYEMWGGAAGPSIPVYVGRVVVGSKEEDFVCNIQQTTKTVGFPPPPWLNMLYCLYLTQGNISKTHGNVSADPKI